MCHHRRTWLRQAVAAEEPGTPEMQDAAVTTKLLAPSEVGIMLLQTKGWHVQEQLAKLRFGRSARKQVVLLHLCIHSLLHA